ncbi:MAG: hypothetical protein G8237_00850 [Magnetococcales bacterium]|nr:chemotaxis protein CheW [Magnetococcales bacterium]NGZ04886.1 hypothetical protein [Magnetococcales bacterium]
MAELSSTDTDYLVFTLNQRRYGVAHHAVMSILDLPGYTVMPGMPPEVRGLMVYQGESIPLFDLRVCFGESTRLQETQELVQTMLLRKQDHINWVLQLKQEVFGNKPITVQMNPDLCAFGQWYKTFKTDNLNLNAHMQYFDDPHRQIHQVAVDAARLLEAGRADEARHLIHMTEGGLLMRLIELFDGVKEQIRLYLLEYVIVFNVGGVRFAMATDKINFFGRLLKIEKNLSADLENNRFDFIAAVGHPKRDARTVDTPILLLDMHRFMVRYPFLRTV